MKEEEIQMKKIKHSEEVVDYCIDNEIAFIDGYCDIIDKKLDSLSDQLTYLRQAIEFTMDDVQYDGTGL